MEDSQALLCACLAVRNGTFCGAEIAVFALNRGALRPMDTSRAPSAARRRYRGPARGDRFAHPKSELERLNSDQVFRDISSVF